MEINDPTHLTGHVCVDASRDEVCVGIYHVIYYVMNDADSPSQSQPSMSEGGGASLFVGGGWNFPSRDQNRAYPNGCSTS